MKHKRLFPIGFMLIFIMVLSACESVLPSGSITQAEEGKILRLNAHEEPVSLHPARIQATQEALIINHMFEGLMKRSPEGLIEEGMAKSWIRSDDGLVYTFTLRDGVKWTNGEPVTALDFEFAWKYALHPSTDTTDVKHLYYISGAYEYNSSNETDEQVLKELENRVGVMAINNRTLEVRLVKPVPYFLELCAYSPFYPISHKVQAYNPNWSNSTSSFISNGPFQLSSWNPGRRIHLIKNDKYYASDLLKLDGIHFAFVNNSNTEWQMYQNGSLHVTNDLPLQVFRQFSSENSPELVVGDTLAIDFLRFNTTEKPFNNVKVRRALAMAIDRKILVERATQGHYLPAYGFVPPGIIMPSGNDYQKIVGDYFSEDVAEAKKLLAEGLAQEGISRLSFTLLHGISEQQQAVAEAIRDMWNRNLGVTIRLEKTEDLALLHEALDYQVSYSSFTGMYTDPISFLELWEFSSDKNHTGWDDGIYDRFIHKAITEKSENMRYEIMIQAETVLINQMPVMPIFFRTRPYAVKSNVIHLSRVAQRGVSAVYADIE